jgi:hypothetical protein
MSLLKSFGNCISVIFAEKICSDLFSKYEKERENTKEKKVPNGPSPISMYTAHKARVVVFPVDHCNETCRPPPALLCCAPLLP